MKKGILTIPKVTISQPFAAIVYKENGDARLKVLSNVFYIHQLKKFKNGEQVTLILTNKKPKRTDAQNRYYWGVYLPEISRQTGEQDIDRLHELFKGKFLTIGVVDVLGQKVRMKKSTTELSISAFSEYILAIQDETGIEPPPTENYDLDSLQKGLKMKEE